MTEHNIYFSRDTSNEYGNHDINSDHERSDLTEISETASLKGLLHGTRRLNMGSTTTRKIKSDQT